MWPERSFLDGGWTQKRLFDIDWWDTPFFRRVVTVGRSASGRRGGHLMEREVSSAETSRPLNHRALWISRVAPWRMTLRCTPDSEERDPRLVWPSISLSTQQSKRPHNCRDPERPSRSPNREPKKKTHVPLRYGGRTESMSSMPGGGRHKEAQALPLSGMARSKAGYSGILQKVGAEGQNVEERMEVAKRHTRAPSQ